MISSAIAFTVNPTPTVPGDTSDLYFSLSAADNSNNKNSKNDEKRIQNTKHACPRCNSGSLTFEGTSAGNGKLIQTITCICGFEWQETWALSNWFWLKSSSSDDHWTSNR
ncbi:MAG: hypothetical protein ACR2IS_01670 [Nitrososphaeraceae archaeon]